MGWRDRLLEILGLGRKPAELAQARTPQEQEPAGKAAPTQRRRLTAVIGLDFGTSCTKCVIGVAGRAIAVSFEGLTSPDNPYLLPTQLWLAGDRSVGLRGSSGALPITGIKVGLMEHPDRPYALGGGNEAAPVVLAAAYLGEVLRYACNWLVTAKRDLLGDVELSWQLNVGLPAKSHDDAGINDAFRRAVHAGWALSQMRGKVYLGVCSEVVKAVSGAAHELAGIAADAVNLIPEVAAEVVGYARSAQRRIGPHLMVDVGATTLDACLFDLSEEHGGYSYAFYATDIRSDLGAWRLHQKRKAAIDPATKGNGAEDPLKPIPKSYREYPGANGAAEQVDREFRDTAEATVQKVAWNAKMKRRSGLVVETERYRGLERVKEGEIRVLMCGGGSRVPLYEEAVRAAGKALAPGGKTNLRLKPFNILRGMEFPARLDAPKLRKADFDRLAVAYGLSHSVDNIGRFTPPSEVEAEPRWWTVEFEEHRP